MSWVIQYPRFLRTFGSPSPGAKSCHASGVDCCLISGSVEPNIELAGSVVYSLSGTVQEMDSCDNEQSVHFCPHSPYRPLSPPGTRQFSNE